MCGVLIAYSKKESLDEGGFLDALKLQHNRGPDNLSVVKISSNLLIGHTRLSIIDLSEASNQPMKSKKGNYLSFNGEIYNFQELRELLKLEGYDFETLGDTEVLLKCLEHNKDESIKKLNGIY